METELGLSFRPADPSDADAVCALVNSAYRGEGSKRGWTTEADLLGGQRTDREGVLDMIRHSRIELAFDRSGGLLACVNLRRDDDETCYLGMLTVDPGRQAGGVGRRMLERAEELARHWGCARMRMCVIDRREELIAYYLRRGYRRTGASEPFPEGDPRYGLPKVKGLRFTGLVKTLS